MSVVTVGTFDGVHRGHRAVLDCVKSVAEAEGLKPLAVTFDRHPLEVVAPDRAPGLIMSPAARDSEIAACGVNPVRVRFDASTRSTTVAGWLRMLHDTWGARVVVVGYDNTFGCDGLEMDVADYKRAAGRLGMGVEVAPVVPGVSSSAIRRALNQGDIAAAISLLGHPYAIEGVVEQGRKIGRTIGVPTANISVDRRLMLPDPGVYSAHICTLSGNGTPEEWHKAVVNIGPRPTVDSTGRTGVEAHLLDFEGDLYGRSVRLEPGLRLRDIRRFGSLAELKAQIDSDIRQAKGL